MASRTYKAKRKNWRELPREKWWIEGAIFEGKENSYIITNVKVTDEWEDSEIWADVIGYLVDPETICQDTGLTDKNGRKIFESDIVRVGKDIYIVFWSECNYEIGIKNKEESMGIAYVYPGGIWVIGNIFDNPELIGE